MPCHSAVDGLVKGPALKAGGSEGRGQMVEGAEEGTNRLPRLLLCREWEQLVIIHLNIGHL